MNETKLKAFYPQVDVAELQQFMEAYKEVCCGSSTGSPIAKLDNPGRFRWLTATRSTIVQTSKVHPGFCNDPMEKLEQLHSQLVED